MYTCTYYCSSSLRLVLPCLLASLIRPMADADAYSSSYHLPILLTTPLIPLLQLLRLRFAPLSHTLSVLQSTKSPDSYKGKCHSMEACCVTSSCY